MACHLVGANCRQAIIKPISWTNVTQDLLHYMYDKQLAT